MQICFCKIQLENLCLIFNKKGMNVQNEVRLIGNLGSDLVVRKNDAGVSFGVVSLAVSSYYMNSKNERVERTEWVKLIVNKFFIERMLDKLKKGAHVFVLGELRSNVYVDDNGKKFQNLEVVCNYMFVL